MYGMRFDVSIYSRVSHGLEGWYMISLMLGKWLDVSMVYKPSHGSSSRMSPRVLAHINGWTNGDDSFHLALFTVCLRVTRLIGPESYLASIRFTRPYYSTSHRQRHVKSVQHSKHLHHHLDSQFIGLFLIIIHLIQAKFHWRLKSIPTNINIKRRLRSSPLPSKGYISC
jgi:hypothetical protein